jgi:hypothetical protein
MAPRPTALYGDAVLCRRRETPRVEVKYGTLKGGRCELQENLDTQVATDLVTKAALNEYDTAVVVSNDGDFVSPVETVKPPSRSEWRSDSSRAGSP